eukprot:scaffold13103_cov77-Cyclotella_meneghiniana.AAC.4
MVKYVGSEGEWMALMEQSKEKLVVVDFTASWSTSEGSDVIVALLLLATISLSGLLLGWGWSGHNYTLSFLLKGPVNPPSPEDKADITA